MAMVKTTSPIIQIQGKVGGEVWRYDQCGQHVQASPRIIEHQPTKKQQLVRNCFRKVWIFFLSELTSNEQDQWRIWANNHPIKNHKGETVYYTPPNAFAHINLPRCHHGLEFVRTPPE